MTNSLHLIKHEAPTAREHLRAAIEAVETAEINHAKSVEARARAANMFTAAEADVKGYANLDTLVASPSRGENEVGNRYRRCEPRT
jgi:hypothetical protein